MQYLRSVTDLDAPTIRRLIDRSRELDQRGVSRSLEGVVGLLFLSSSLRTRAGFAAAAARLGLACIDVSEPRSGTQMSASESVQDTLRTFSGMVDVVVVRSDWPVAELELERNCVAPFVNGGDGGPAPEHPTQALIDLRAIEDEAGPVEEQVIAISGDLTQRAARSLITAFGVVPPRRLVLMGAPERETHAVELPATLDMITECRDPDDVDDVDVLYLPGLPENSTNGALEVADRRRFAFSGARAGRLPSSAVVLSPLPVIDEVAEDCRNDPRVRLFGPSDRAVSVRAAVLEWVRQS